MVKEEKLDKSRVVIYKKKMSLEAIELESASWGEVAHANESHSNFLSEN